MHSSESASSPPAQAPAATLALFDLDHTLLPIDSDYEWARFLIRLGAVDGEEYERRNDLFFDQYHAGTLDIHEFLAFQLAPLAAHPRSQLEAWRRRFMDEVIAPAIRPAARALVDGHRERGDLCAIVTATNEFVTRPIARLFGIDELIATELERDGAGRITGAIRGVPAFQAGKIARVEAWLAARGLAWDDVERSSFYSDSPNDLPLLERVSHPVATNPVPRLAEIAAARGWPVLRLFDQA